MTEASPMESWLQYHHDQWIKAGVHSEHTMSLLLLTDSDHATYLLAENILHLVDLHVNSVNELPSDIFELEEWVYGMLVDSILSTHVDTENSIGGDTKNSQYSGDENNSNSNSHSIEGVSCFLESYVLHSPWILRSENWDNFKNKTNRKKWLTDVLNNGVRDPSRANDFVRCRVIITFSLPKYTSVNRHDWNIIDHQITGGRVTIAPTNDITHTSAAETPWSELTKLPWKPAQILLLPKAVAWDHDLFTQDERISLITTHLDEIMEFSGYEAVCQVLYVQELVNQSNPLEALIVAKECLERYIKSEDYERAGTEVSTVEEAVRILTEIIKDHCEDLGELELS